MIEITPIEAKTYDKIDSQLVNDKHMSIFLGGTIDSGSSIDWQKALLVELNKRYSLPNLTVYNPRRAVWPSDSDSDVVKKQILWEQKNLDNADYIFMFLADDSKSPISLLELGLYAESGKLYVFFTDKFYRSENVELTCEKYKIPYLKTNDIGTIANFMFQVMK